MQEEEFPVVMRLRDTPVPIPNTKVKTQSADDTWLETTRASRWLPESQLILDSSAVEQPAVNRWVVGSNPTRGALFRLGGQAVKTRPFHGCNPGSIPGRVIVI